jgi:hypothetical protein
MAVLNDILVVIVLFLFFSICFIMCCCCNPVCQPIGATICATGCLCRQCFKKQDRSKRGFNEADQERQFCSMEERLAMAAALRRPFPGTV